MALFERTLTPVTTTLEQATALCRYLAAYFNAQYISPANMYSPFSCLPPVQPTPNNWLLSMNAEAATAADASVVISNAATGQALLQLATMSSNFVGWNCTNLLLFQLCTQPPTILNQTLCISTTPSPPSPTPPVSLPPPSPTSSSPSPPPSPSSSPSPPPPQCAMSFTGFSSPQVKTQSQAQADCANGATYINNYLLSGVSLLSPFSCYFVQGISGGPWSLAMSALAASLADASKVIANFNSPFFPNIAAVAGTIGWSCGQYTLAAAACTSSTSQYTQCSSPSPPPPPSPSPPPSPPCGLSFSGVSAPQVTTSVQAQADCSRGANYINAALTTGATLSVIFSCFPVQGSSGGPWSLAMNAQAASQADAIRVISNFNSPTSPNIAAVAAVIGWSCGRYNLAATCTQLTSNYVQCVSPPPSPPSPPPLPPPPVNPCPMRFTEATLSAIQGTSDTVMQTCNSVVTAWNNIIFAVLGPALIIPFQCAPPTQLQPGYWNITSYGSANGQANAGRIMALFNSTTAATLAAVSGWPCAAMDLAATCPPSVILYTVCPSAVPPLSPSPPSPLSPPSPPSPPPRPPTLTCSLSYTAVTCYGLPSTASTALINSRCQQVAATLNMLYLAGVNLLSTFQCISSSAVGLSTLAVTATRFDEQLFWNNFFTSSSGIMPMVTVTGDVYPCGVFQLFSSCSGNNASYDQRTNRSPLPPAPPWNMPYPPPPPPPNGGLFPLFFSPPPSPPVSWNAGCYAQYIASGAGQRYNVLSVGITSMCANVALALHQQFDNGVSFTRFWTCTFAVFNRIEIQLYPSTPADLQRLFVNVRAAGGFSTLLPIMTWPSVDAVIFSTCTTDFFEQALTYGPPPPVPPAPQALG